MLNAKMNNIPSASLLLHKYFLILMMLEARIGFGLKKKELKDLIVDRLAVHYH